MLLRLLVACLLAFTTNDALAANKSEALKSSIAARWSTRRDLNAWKAKVRNKTFGSIAPTSGGAIASVVFAKEAKTGLDIVIRQPENTTEAVRLHTAIARLAGQLGAPTIVEPATRVVPRGDQTGLLRGSHSVMITRRAPTSFRPAGDAPAGWLAKVSEERRLIGAVLDALSHQQDRMPKNLLIAENGDYRLIDQDSTFGRGEYWQNPSVFHPGGSLAYSSRQDSFADLPSKLRDQVAEIAGARPQTLHRRYGLSDSESRYLRATAKLIVERGLTRAIDKLMRAGAAMKEQ